MNAPVAATEDLIYSVEDGIARIIFNRPQARNALTFAMYEQMASICESINQDRSIKALIITGAGDKAFASGTDISQFRAFKTAQDALDYEAQEALALGLLNEIVPDVTVLQRRAEETAKLVASHAPITLEVTKEAVRRIRRTLSRDEGEDLILKAYMSEDFREGMDAFLNKRTPNWKGE